MFHVKHPRSYAASRGANGGVAPPRRRRGKSQAVRERALRRREERRACVAAWSRRLGSRKSSRTKRVGTVRSTLGSRGCPWQPKRHPRAQTEGAGRSGAEGPRRPRTARATLGPRRKGRAAREQRVRGAPERRGSPSGPGGRADGPRRKGGSRGPRGVRETGGPHRAQTERAATGVGHHWARDGGASLGGGGGPRRSETAWATIGLRRRASLGGGRGSRRSESARSGRRALGRNGLGAPRSAGLTARTRHRRSGIEMPRGRERALDGGATRATRVGSTATSSGPRSVRAPAKLESSLCLAVASRALERGIPGAKRVGST